MKNEINFNLLIPGTLSKLTNRQGSFFHLTWKENNKTITRYVRIDEVKQIREGIKEYQKAKKNIEQTAKKNLKLFLKKRKRK